jgi:retron-type reverse transcriptase
LDRREQEPALAKAGDARITALLDGSYQPQPVRGVEIPKPGGGKRQLGIPTVVDRLVQQAILSPRQPPRCRALASVQQFKRVLPMDVQC